MQDAKTNQNRFKLGLNKTRKEILKTKKKQINALYKIQMHFTVIKFFDDYFAMVSQSIHELT